MLLPSLATVDTAVVCDQNGYPLEELSSKESQQTILSWTVVCEQNGDRFV